MKAQEFWDRLEYRVCDELEKMPSKELRRYWCDGFIPDRAELLERPYRIEGRVWFGVGSRNQESWDFALLLPTKVERQEDIIWEHLLPPQDASGWIEMNVAHRQVVIDVRSSWHRSA